MNIELKDYMDAMKRYSVYVLEKKEEPRTVRFVDTTIGKKEYANAFARVFLFLEKEGKLPLMVRINSPVDSMVRSEFFKKFEAVVGKFKNATELYTLLAKFHYLFYENDRYKNEGILERMKQGIGSNCVDYCQVIKQILDEMGYTVRFVHGQVRCNDNQWYGHIWLEVSGHEFTKPTIFDAVSAVKATRRLGVLCCVNGLRGPHGTANVRYYNEIPASWRTY